ncbi:NAD(P)-dependent oxidoreductase [Streptomyces sp. NPDC057257]|uniref:NAD(P)-dependent oxidoreductase n=1 Tax=Streptomyces sp. NPDC057257 TaxID=3346071 RepID=UPI003643051A
MKLLVLGATGRLVVDQALAAGHTVRALVRSLEKLDARPGLDVVSGQATDAGDVTQAMTGVGAVISTLGATRGTVISFAMQDRRGGRAARQRSRLHPVHAVRLTNDPATGITQQLPKSATLRMGDTISRADVAAWMLSALTSPTTSRRSVVIAG